MFRPNSPTTDHNRINSRPLIVLLILLYAILAMSDNFKGIFVPFFKEDFQISNTLAGYLMTASLLVYALFQYIGGILVERLGHKRVVGLGILLAVIALVGLGTSRSFAALLTSMALLNSGMAMFNVTVNTLGPLLPVASTVVLMNIINFSYGVSNTAAQKFTGSLLARGVSWRAFYWFMLVCLVLLFGYLSLLQIPHYHRNKALLGAKGRLFSNKMLYFFILALGFYLAAEYGTGNWFVNYMTEAYHLDPNQRSIYIALFFGLETVGRLFGGFVAARLGYSASMLIYGSGALALTTAGILLGRPGLLIIALAGLFYSILYPTLMLSISDVFQESAAYAIGLILMSGTLIAMLVNLLMGIANDRLGVQPAFLIISICQAGFVLMVALIRISSRSKSDKSPGTSPSQSSTGPAGW